MVQVSIDTACSSALVGAHMAVQHLQAHSGTALSAGVNLMLAEHTTAATQVAGMLSAEGRCKTLDASADGYVRAEACVVLRLDATDGRGSEGLGAVIIKGTFVNQVRPDLPMKMLAGACPLLMATFGFQLNTQSALHMPVQESAPTLLILYQPHTACHASAALPQSSTPPIAMTR